MLSQAVRFRHVDKTGAGKILLYYDPIFELHDTGSHPENAARLLPTTELLNSLARDEAYGCPQWKPAALDRIQRVHSPAYVNEIKSFANAGGGQIEQDTFLSRKSFEVALMAVGAVCDAVERIDRGEDSTAFCLVRPPGHHALTDQAMGFCLFNNVAVGARLAIQELGYDRVLIVDWDVHHGNGTQDTFWEDPQVGYFSMHRDPFYPNTGSATETGAGPGLGTTRNLPIKFGTPREQVLQQFQREVNDFADEIGPQLVFVSAGFDAHKDDPIGSLGLAAEDFDTMTQVVQAIAHQHTNGRIISVLEGGYNPLAVADCVAAHLAVLNNRKDFR